MLTAKQIEMLKELADQDVFTMIMETVGDSITQEWRAGTDVEARELSHAKFMALRDVRRQIRKLVGAKDDG